MIIRQAERGDLPGIAAIEEQGINGPWSARQLESEFVHPASLLLVAELDKLLQGYICCRIYAAEAELLRLVVLPARRRQGVAVELLRTALSLLAGQGVKICFLEVRSGNNPARSLYIKHGYFISGIRPKYYRRPQEDAILMRIRMIGSLEEE